MVLLRREVFVNFEGLQRRWQMLRARLDREFWSRGITGFIQAEAKPRN